MRILKFLYLATGLALLIAVFIQVDLGEAFTRALDVGWGFTVIVAIYAVAFLIDCLTWQISLLVVPLSATWLYRCWKIRMVGELFNYVLPAGGMGGEPLKAELLKRYYGVGYRDGAASLIRIKTINIMGLAVFLSIGFALMLASDALNTPYKLAAGIGLAAFVLGVSLLFLVQRFRLSSRAATWMQSSRFGARLGSIVAFAHDMDERLVDFYTRHRSRFLAALALSVGNWVTGCLEIYATLWFLGHPIIFTDAWIIEGVVQLTRAASFVIPANIGVLEGGFVLVFAEMMAAPALGLAVVVVRRAREIVWLLAGAVVGLVFSFARPLLDAESSEPDPSDRA
ncbi:MAG: hypothetical protein EXQ90_09015 [Rhodospirillales bacterium]|nr:hypothetical protein [Rhodospirillales bacterium]